jgi:hypothetical protein
MPLQLSFPRIAFFVACSSIYGVLGGFSFPHIPSSLQPAASEVPRTQLLCTILFGTSAWVASLVLGKRDTYSAGGLRMFWLILGFFGMALAAAWMRLLRIAAQKLAEAAT